MIGSKLVGQQAFQTSLLADLGTLCVRLRAAQQGPASIVLGHKPI